MFELGNIPFFIKPKHQLTCQNLSKFEVVNNKRLFRMKYHVSDKIALQVAQDEFGCYGVTFVIC